MDDFGRWTSSSSNWRRRRILALQLIGFIFFEPMHIVDLHWKCLYFGLFIVIPYLLINIIQAKALPDMVIVVQSEQSSWESQLQCNGKSLLWDLRRPVKAAWAATAEHLAGLLPLHLVYSHAHETAIEISTVAEELHFADAMRLLTS